MRHVAGPKCAAPEAERLRQHLSFSEARALAALVAILGDRQERIITLGEVVGDVVKRPSLLVAMQKAAIAGVLVSRSMGVRGTHVRILRPDWLREVAGGAE